MKSWSPWRRKFELGRSFPYPATSNKNHNQTRIKSKQKGHSEFKEDGICSSSNPFYNVAHSSEKLTWFHLFFFDRIPGFIFEPKNQKPISQS